MLGAGPSESIWRRGRRGDGVVDWEEGVAIGRGEGRGLQDGGDGDEMRDGRRRGSDGKEHTRGGADDWPQLP